LEVRWERVISARTYEEVAAVVKEEVFEIGVSARIEDIVVDKGRSLYPR